MGRRKHFKIIISKKEEKEREAVEERARELKKFFRGKKWNKNQREEMEKQGKPPLIINMLPKLEKGAVSGKIPHS